MKTWSCAPYALTIATLTIAEGCSGGSTPTPPVVAPLAAHGASASWMSPDAVKESLLYVSDAENDRVDVYKNYRSRSVALEGQLTDLQYPAGECVDGAGNVYITEFYGQETVEYAHGGNNIIKTLAVPGFPIGCSVDPTTGNLAVTSWEETQGYNSSGGVFVFIKASGTPTLYTTNVFQMFPPGYDPNGNLFVLGYNPKVELNELPHGGSSFHAISLGSTIIYNPGGVMWDGSYIAATDEQYQGGNATAIYRVSVAGTKGRVVGTTVLTDSCSSSPNSAYVMQPWIHGATVVGGNHFCKDRFDFWSFPNGGNPNRTLPAGIAPLDAIGQTISP